MQTQFLKLSNLNGSQHLTGMTLGNNSKEGPGPVLVSDHRTVNDAAATENED